MIISIDFDGTIVRERWPDIGAPLPGALAAIRKLHAAGHTIIINSCRAGAAEDADDVLAQILGEHDRGIAHGHPRVFKRLFLAIVKTPVDVFIVMQFIDDVFPDVDIARHAARSAFVFVHDGDWHALGIRVRIPIGDYAVPCIQAWKDKQRDDDDQGDGIASQRLKIPQ